jgi:hypothetical protein
MRRRIIWRYGDSAPVFGHMIAAVEGDGELKVFVGFPVSSVEVAFSKIYNRFLLEQVGYGYGGQEYAFEPEVWVRAIDDDGFTLAYRNIVETLDVNYFVM